MGWKERITLGDLPPTTQVELTCKSCGKFRYIPIGKLIPRHPAKAKYLDEFEDCQVCHVWGCGGACRIALPPDSDSEGFQGGLA